ncbi:MULTISPECIES: PIN domain-containing protein [Cyanophyceae]|uniref:PIN domain-containing protein n=1 Tax=Cyanophyceae TaxID=3028117 RepID=UPI00168622DF|nr:PIN domain-containing protein [Trichocoleus sp. FACHB-69]MBD1931907.1 type II toxin-antitoxin system VapC family toxin [Trichocoleus sp. FACHB-69]
MSQYILDTDHLTFLQRHHPLVVQRVATINPRDIAVTIVTVEEQLRGRLDSIRQASTNGSQADRLVLAYTRLGETLDDFKSINILKFDEEAYIRYADLRSQRIRIGTQDLKIAAISLSKNSILVTRNQRDFAQVPDLIFEDWTILP